MRVLARSALCLLLLTAAGPVRADTEADETVKAKALYSRGMAHFQLEEWDQAIEKWEEGFRIRPVPEFLYNIAQAYRLSKRSEKALSFYQKYLRMGQKVANRAEVERHIQMLQRSIEAQQRALTQAPVQPLPEPLKGPTPSTESVAVAESTAVAPRPAQPSSPQHARATEPPRLAASASTAPSQPTPVNRPAPVAAQPTLAPVEAAPASAQVRPELTQRSASTDTRPVYKKGWFWGVVGGAVVVVAGATVGAVVATSGSSIKTLPAFQF